MGCGCSGNARRPTFRTPAGGTDQALAAAGATEYEVVDARGNPTGRFFMTLGSATNYARSIGGSTRPV